MQGVWAAEAAARGAAKQKGEKSYMIEKEKFSVSEIFGENVFNDAVMQERLPKKTYKRLREVIEGGHELDSATADVTITTEAAAAIR